ncbi:hypothetical protein M406DRAFT_100615 [Cryphonectria parasitica EP155]|uniref:Uncharacterized protein n=1 Tax=Cryphonectria parasitica (strain ATCC 38755 / EP155) TaxID=660469 RepID=A0A9P4YBA9_CRYP1|nr:uncharacterized protein M406DRAFT_100615 [Cryphonectria parasitica EP155]KAF3769901.1 hypothetical protein M406DRAFT_100615 [Cryphonectria parasitica EP155]
MLRLNKASVLHLPHALKSIKVPSTLIMALKVTILMSGSNHSKRTINSSDHHSNHLGTRSHHIISLPSLYSNKQVCATYKSRV